MLGDCGELGGILGLWRTGGFGGIQGTFEDWRTGEFQGLEELWIFKGLWRTGGGVVRIQGTLEDWMTGGTGGPWRTGGNWRTAHSGGSSPSTHLDRKTQKYFTIWETMFSN